MTTYRLSTHLTYLIICILVSVTHAQDTSYERILDGVDGSDFFAIQDAMNTYYQNNPEARGENKWRRKEWFLEPRLFPEGKMENLVLKTFREQEKYFKSQPPQRTPHGGWIFLGPSAWQQSPPPGGGNSGLGRINSIDFHPTNDQIIYAGTASGGLWKTTNGGTSWTNISPRIPLLSVADVEVDYTNANTIYMLTGDGDPLPIDAPTSHNQSGATSIGILKSTDGGATWYPTGFSFSQPLGVEPYKLLMHPTDPEIQFVAAQQGIYKTSDGWQSYTQENFSVTYDIEFNPDDPLIMYASGATIIRRSIDGGDTWIAVTDPDLIVFNTSSRIELAVSPDLPSVVYAIGGNWAGYHATFQSLLSGINNSWVLKDSTSTHFGGFATYCIAATVDPNDYRDIYAGFSGFTRNFNQGATGSWTGHYAGHPDIHDVQMRNGVLYCAHDGGLWKSTNNGTGWTEISGGIACTEAYTVTGTSLNTNVYIIGAQDVGHLKRTASSTTFTTVGCCDGMISIIHPTDINTIYISGQEGGINKSTTGLPPFTSIGNPGTGGAWNTPYIMDPVDPNILFVGKDSVHRTNAGGGTWQYLGRPFTGNINCMAQGVSNRNRLYVSTSSSIKRTDNALVGSGTATWVDINTGLPSLFITGIAVNPDDANEVFITYSGYNAAHKVYQSTSSGTGGSWVNITGNLPNVPVNCIEYHDNGTGNDALYIGTDIGVFYRDNNLGDWIYFSNYMPSVSVSDLYINYANSTIAAGTYGRGLWLSSLYDPCDANIALSGSNLGGTLYFSASNQITSSAAHPFDVSNDTHYRAGNYIDLTDGFRAGGLSFFEGIIGPCPSPIENPLMSPFVPSGHLVLNEAVQAFIAKED